MSEFDDEESDREAFDSEDAVDMEDSETGEETESETTGESESEMSEATANEGGTEDDSEAGSETEAVEEEGGDQDTYRCRDGCEAGADFRQAMLAGKSPEKEGDELTAPEMAFLVSILGAKAVVWPDGVQTDEFVWLFWEGRGQNLEERRRWRLRRRKQWLLMREWLRIDASNERQNFGHETQKAGSSGEGERSRLTLQGAEEQRRQ